MAEAGATAGTRAGSEDFVHPAKDGVYVKLRVSPGAKSTRIKDLYEEEAVRLSVTAPPTEGRVNAEVEGYLARLLEVSRSAITVVKGVQSRDKLVFARLWGGRTPSSSRRSSLKDQTYLRTSSNFAGC